MTISLKHTFTSAKSDGADSTLVQPSNWNAEHTMTAAAGKVIGRDTSGAGAVQELPIAVDTSGNVGIGTAAPSQKLDVRDGYITNTRYGNTGALEMNTAGGTAASPTAVSTSSFVGAILSKGYDGSAYREVSQIITVSDGAISPTSSPGRIQFATTPSGSVTPTLRMVIDSAGSIGLGVTPSASDVVLTQTTDSGTFSWKGANGYLTSNAVYSGGAWKYATTAAAGMYYHAGGAHVFQRAASGTAGAAVSFTTSMLIDNAGKVGIGTSSPSVTLEVRGVTYVTNGTNYVILSDVDGSIELTKSAGDAYLDFKTTLAEDYDCRVAQVNNGLAFSTGGNGATAERLRIDSAGNLIQQGGVYFQMTAPASKSAAATLTGAEVVQGYIQYTGAAANLTLPTAANLQAALPADVAALNDIAFDFTIINTGTGTATLVVNTGITAVGALTTAISTATTFHIRKTATNTFIVYRT